jgi:hypothetical protein
MESKFPKFPKFRRYLRTVVFLLKFWTFFTKKQAVLPAPAEAPAVDDSRSEGMVKVLKKGPAMRVIFFYPGEEGTYVDHAEVTLYENGIIHIQSNQEETTTHLQNCEILWRFETDADDRSSKVRLLKKAEPRANPDSPELGDKPPTLNS